MTSALEKVITSPEMIKTMNSYGIATRCMIGEEYTEFVKSDIAQRLEIWGVEP